VNIPIHPRQHAFQTAKSTESALHHLVGRIERALDAGQYALGVFFDIQGAFDNTAILSVHQALSERKVIPGHSGVDGNEVADSLATQASYSDFIGPEPAIGITVTTVRCEIRSWANKEHLNTGKLHLRVGRPSHLSMAPTGN